jgi:Immunity protein 10
MGGMAVMTSEPFFTVTYVTDETLSDIATRVLGITEDPIDPSAKSFLFERSTEKPTPDERQLGMDDYAISTHQGVSEYAPLASYELTRETLILSFTEEGSDSLGIARRVVLMLALNDHDWGILDVGLRAIICNL